MAAYLPMLNPQLERANANLAKAGQAMKILHAKLQKERKVSVRVGVLRVRAGGAPSAHGAQLCCRW